jgi:hypothetical protein
MKRHQRWFRLFGIIFIAAAAWFIADQVDAKKATRIRYSSLKGSVMDSQKRPLVNATVYFIDSSMVDTTPIHPTAILDGSAEAYDEPLEDIINNPDKLALLPKAVTDKKGRFRAKKLNRDAKYYTFVVPGEDNPDYLPSGDASRIAFVPAAIPKTGLNVTMSWKAVADATNIGTTACMVCHGAGSDLPATNCAKSAHSLMFTRPGQLTPYQSLADHPQWFEFANKFTLATAYTDTGVTQLHFADFQSASPRFNIYEGTPPTGTVIAITAFLWKTAANEYKLTLKNVGNTADLTVLTLDIPLLMGGYIRQRLVAKHPDPLGQGLRSLYPLFTYQAFTGSSSQGSNANYDRARKVYSEGGPGGGGISTFLNLPSGTSGGDRTKITINANPKVVNTDGTYTGLANTVQSCARCHIGPNATETFVHAGTSERRAKTVSDPNGMFDLDGDGGLDEMSISCETCHGPGSKHREEAIKAVQPSSKTTEVTTVAKYIVNPKFLSADRSSMICGRCHSEMNFVDASKNVPTVYANPARDAFPPPGISRAELLANFAKPRITAAGVVTDSGKGSSFPSGFWPDGEHERAGHRGQAYGGWLESHHARNHRQLVSCDDCHSSMGDSSHRYLLKGNPDDSTTAESLCLKCHAQNIVEHAIEQTGDAMTAGGTNCTDCHMPRVGRGGAGRAGLILGTPTGTATDANIIYWHGDQAAHSFHVPKKFSAGVAGVQPATAMPVPYTNACGTCHDASSLRYQQPK